jgi:hypothetical protein
MLPIGVCCLLCLRVFHFFAYAGRSVEPVLCPEALIISPSHSKSKICVNTKAYYFWPFVIMFNINLRLPRRGVVSSSKNLIVPLNIVSPTVGTEVQVVRQTHNGSLCRVKNPFGRLRPRKCCINWRNDV